MSGPQSSKEDPQQIAMEAQRLRALEINRACSLGRVIVNDPYFNADNPHWKKLARENLYGAFDDFRCGVASPLDDARYVQTSNSQDFVGDYLASQPSRASSMAKTHMSFLKKQQKVNATQDYTRFGGSKKTQSSNKKK